MKKTGYIVLVWDNEIYEFGEKVYLTLTSAKEALHKKVTIDEPNQWIYNFKNDYGTKYIGKIGYHLEIRPVDLLD